MILIYLYLFTTLFLSAILQIIIPFYISFGFIPELVLISVLFFSLRYGSFTGEIYGFFAGLLMDAMTVHIFGLRALIFTFFGYILGIFSKKLDESKPEVQVLVTFLSVLIYYFIENITVNREGYGLVRLAANLLINCALAPLVFSGLGIFTGKMIKWSGRANLQ